MSENVISFGDALTQRQKDASRHKFSLDVFEAANGAIWAQISYDDPDVVDALPGDLEQLAFWDRLASDDPHVAVFRLAADGDTQMLVDNERIVPTGEQAAWLRERLEEGVKALERRARGAQP